MRTDDFYRAFEDRHRGTRESIQQRQSIYLSFLRPLAQVFPDGALLDLGCGRGEWLELVRREGWTAVGVDTDEGMLQAARDAGLDVRRHDALAFLKALPDASVTALTAFHLVEHLPFDVLQALAAEARRVLCPGGVLILETPNPENLVVGSCSFHMDPTHAKPLPPPLLSFLLEYHGFSRVKTLRLHEGIAPGSRVDLIDVLAGVSPDYAVVAQNGAPVDPGDPARAAASAALDAAFIPDRGFNLNQLAERYDADLQARLRSVEVNAALALEAALAAQRQRTQEIEHMEMEISALETQVEAMYASSSWRVTAPLRWAGAQRLALRQQGLVGRARHVARRAALALPRAALRTLDRHPQLREKVVGLVRRSGLERHVRRFLPPDSTPGAVPIAAEAPPSKPAPLPASAHRAEAALRQALASDAQKKKDR